MRHAILILAFSFSFLVGALSLAGCSGIGSHDPEWLTGRSASLAHADSCDDLLGMVQEDALAKIEEQTQQYLDWYAGGSGGGWGLMAEDGAGRAEPSAPSSEPTNFSETNVQVEGVDEGDIVKNTGSRIYVVSGDRLQVVDSWPIEEVGLIASAPIEGSARELLIEGDRAVVFSSTDDPRTDDRAECDVYGGWYPCWYSRGFTKATVFDVSGEAPRQLREVYVEGWYLRSRRHDSDVRLVTNTPGLSWWYGDGLPNVWEYLEFWTPGGDYRAPTAAEARAAILRWRADAIDAVRAKPLEDWLPRAFERTGAGLTDLGFDCDSFHVTGPGLSSWGVAQVVALDLTDGGSFDRTGVWGWAREVYANHDAMVLIQDDASAWIRARRGDDPFVRTRSIVHRFGLEEGQAPRYEASGFVPGSIVDQFSVDERDGVIRIATTERLWRWNGGTPRGPFNRVLTLERDGRSSRLQLIGATPALAEGEQVQSARFLGDRAYVVTFRQVDPLYVVDISDPTALEVLGELKITGFSTYMHPLGEDHLLTIGFEADERTGRVEGLALSIFDVSDPVDPVLRHRHLFEDDWGSSEAAWDHRAFTFYEHRGVAYLAFPYVAWGERWETFRSSLELFEVDAEAGFDHAMSVDHTDLLTGLCADDEYGYCRSYALQIRRGLFVEDYVYSLSWGGLRVHDVRSEAHMTDVPF